MMINNMTHQALVVTSPSPVNRDNTSMRDVGVSAETVDQHSQARTLKRIYLSQNTSATHVYDEHMSAGSMLHVTVMITI